ncbi:MAG: hypothetical protein LBR83_00990 [Clostridiales bacterium]|jgi:hypothetical protein|nr:hypothetical protein [Clostridiales bacterium]
MKTYAAKTISAEELAEIRCNRCGRPIEKNDFGIFDEHLSIEKIWGYHSPADGETHKLDICSDCYFGWIEEFEIPPINTKL